MKIYLHTGTEKTATTSLQGFLHANRQALLARGFATLDSVGRPNNRRLVAFFMRDHEFDDFFRRNGIGDLAAKQRFRDDFLRDFERELAGLPAHVHSVVVTSEHFHSRLRNRDVVASVRTFLDDYFDDFEIVSYFREQSAVARSVYSTAIKSGFADTFDEYLATVHVKNHYYNYFNYFNKWERPFGLRNLRARLFGPEHFAGGDIRTDFLSLLGLAPEGFDFDQKRLNESLGLSGLTLGRAINDAFPRYLPDGSESRVNRLLIAALSETGVGGHGRAAFAEGDRIWREFDESNVRFARRHLGMDANPFPRPRPLDGDASPTVPLADAAAFVTRTLALLGGRPAGSGRRTKLGPAALAAKAKRESEAAAAGCDAKARPARPAANDAPPADAGREADDAGGIKRILGRLF